MFGFLGKAVGGLLGFGKKVASDSVSALGSGFAGAKGQQMAGGGVSPPVTATQAPQVAGAGSGVAGTEGNKDGFVKAITNRVGETLGDVMFEVGSHKLANQFYKGDKQQSPEEIGNRIKTIMDKVYPGTNPVERLGGGGGGVAGVGSTESIANKQLNMQSRIARLPYSNGLFKQQVRQAKEITKQEQMKTMATPYLLRKQGALTPIEMPGALFNSATSKMESRQEYIKNLAKESISKLKAVSMPNLSDVEVAKGTQRSYKPRSGEKTTRKSGRSRR